MIRRSYPRRAVRRPKRKVVFAREAFGGNGVATGTVTITPVLANFETQYGAQILGATVVGLRGRVSVRTRSSAPVNGIHDWAYGFYMSNQEGDLSPNHPSPLMSSANPDRNGDWMWIEQTALFQALVTPVAGATTRDWQSWQFQTRCKRTFRELESVLYLCMANGTQSTVDWTVSVSVALALP